MTKNLLVALLTLSAGAALAQEAETAPAESVPPPSIEERVITAEGKIGAIEEQYSETKSDVSVLKKIQLSGHVQGRFLYLEPDEDEANPGTRLNEGYTRFVVRRARLKVNYDSDYGQVLIQIDAVPSGVTIKDAEATLYIPGTKKNMSLTLGQMKWPFGYELLQSSTERELPERSLVVRTLMPGERDRGLRFNGKFGLMRLSAGIFEGIGTAAATTDNDKEKDFVGRLSFDLKWLSGGVSGWYGNTLGRRTTGDNPDTFRTAYARTRLGADVQLYLDVVPVGGTAIKAEYITGRTYLQGSSEVLGVPASGWWAQIAQNVGLSDVLALRYDYFDYENGLGPTESGSKTGSHNAVSTLSVAAIHYFGDKVKLTAAYEMPMTDTVDTGLAEDPSDNLFTLQLQASY